MVKSFELNTIFSSCYVTSTFNERTTIIVIHMLPGIAISFIPCVGIIPVKECI